MAKVELVLFDFDGTLVDTAPDLIRATNLYLKSQGLEEMPNHRIRAEIGMGMRQFILDLYPPEQRTEELFRKIEKEFIAIYENEFLKTPRFFDGALEFLTEWDGQIAILSNKRTRFIHPILKALGADAFPWVRIIGGDTYTNMKPHPEPFIAAMTAAGVGPESTVIVGDGAPDIEGALAVGCRSIAVHFGYHPVEELVDLGADYTIESYEDLLPLIRSLT